MRRENVCLECGKPLAYFEEAQEVVCCICGKKEMGRCICTAGHYVCDACHRAGGVDVAMAFCLGTDSEDPVWIAQQIMANKAVYPNGPEHHSIVGMALMTAYRNAGGEIDLERGLEELRRRSMQVPGGACGYWGVCGAATSAGQFWSIASGSTPMTCGPWAQCQRLTSRVLGKLADLGGPRCCKRTGFASILETAAFVRETCGVRMSVPESVTCTFSEGNRECLRERCPYHPGA